MNETDVDLLNVEFKWHLGSEERAHFKLFLDSNLDDAVEDTILVDDFFTVKSLLPGKEYKWSLEFEDKVLNATFSTRNPLAILKNQYEVVTHKSFRSAVCV